MLQPANKPRQRMEVPLLDLRAQYREIRDEVMEAISAVCEGQHFILGPRVKDLEVRIAEYAQCRFGIGVSSGTDALLAALMALEVGPGDEVITSPYSFFATGGVVARLGARPVYCDVDPVTFNLSAAAVSRFIESQCERRDGVLVNRGTGGRVKVLMPVHLFGQVADMGRSWTSLGDTVFGWWRMRRRRSVPKVPAGAGRALSATSACFSFFPSKNLGAFGDGGMCTTNDPALAERLAVLRVHGGKPKYHHAVIGGNFRLDELQAAVLLVKFSHLDGWTARRQANADFYDRAFADSGLEGQVMTPVASPGHRHIYNQYVLRVSQRDELRKHLADAGIGTEVYYPIPLHVQKCFDYLGYRPEDCPESMHAAA